MLNWSLAMVGLQNLLPINPKRITQENQNINLILIKMKTFAIIIMNIGIAFILTLIATGIILFFENEGIEISGWSEGFIGFSIGLYCTGKVYYELDSN